MLVLVSGYAGGCWWVIAVEDVLTALSPDAEAMLEALVRVGAGDDFRAGAAHVHVPLLMHDVAGVTLEPVGCKTHRNALSELWRTRRGIVCSLLQNHSFCPFLLV